MISVAMASYNGSKYIEEQLDSILAQTMPVDEIVITDDNSTDDTVDVINKYIKLHPEANIRLYLNQANLGYKRNFKTAMSYCSGDYLFLCDQDDIWYPEKVEKMLEIMGQYPSIQALASSFVLIDQDGNPKKVDLIPNFSNNNLYRVYVKPDDLVEVPFDELTIQNGFQGCALCITKKMNDLFQKCFTEELFHDWLINLLAAEEHGMYFYNHPLFKYRIHEKNTIGIQENEQYTKLERLAKTSELETRTLFAINCVETISVLERVDPDINTKMPDHEQKRIFYQNHILYLTEGKPLRILLQNFSPYYSNIKTNKARVMDFFIALKRMFIK